MSSPSKIPILRPRSQRKPVMPESTTKLRAPSKRLNAKENQITNKTKKTERQDIKSFQSQDKQKKSPLQEIQNRIKQHNENQGVKMKLRDRRGISEIKKSEFNLRVMVDSLEGDLSAMKRELSEVKHVLEKKTTEVQQLKKNESALEQALEESQRESEFRARALEELSVDPVTGTSIKTTEILDSLVAYGRQEQENFITDFRSCLRDLDKSLDTLYKN